MSKMFGYVDVTSAAASQIKRNNAAAEKLYEIINQLPSSREKSLALTKLEECVMWANKSASRNM